MDSKTVVLAVSGGYVISSNVGAPFYGRTTLYARHISSGAPAWHRTLAPDTRFMAADGGAVYVGGRGNLITALAVGTGKTAWTTRLSAPAQAAAAAGDVLYVIDANATVYAIQARPGGPS